MFKRSIRVSCSESHENLIGVLEDNLTHAKELYAPLAPGTWRKLAPMCLMLHVLRSLDWVAISALVVAGASLWVAVKTLKDAEESWKQQKWFDLYAKADEAYDAFDLYCKVWAGFLNPSLQINGLDFPKRQYEWNNLMFLIKRVHSMAMVFPKHLAIDKLVEATVFDTPEDASQPERLKLFFDAVQDMREMAVLDPSVLEIRKR